ncbi:MAG TPA: hypothetical protein VFZ64_03330 [Nocardioidaceae bacterium]
MDDLERLLEHYSVADLNTLQNIFNEGRHRRTDVSVSETEDETSPATTYHRAGARRAPGACTG